MTVTAADFDLERIPAHLRMHYAVTDDAGRITARADSIAELQRATTPAVSKTVKRTLYRTWTDDASAHSPNSGPSTSPVSASRAIRPSTRSPTTPDAAVGVVVIDAASEQARDRLAERGIVALLDLAIPPLHRRVAGSLGGATERLALSQSRMPISMSCWQIARAARSATWLPASAPGRCPRCVLPRRSAPSPRRSVPRITESAPEYFSLAVEALGWVAPVRAAIDRHAGSLAADDVAEQLDNLVFDGFVAATARRHLENVPRYLAAAEARLAALPGVRRAGSGRGVRRGPGDRTVGAAPDAGTEHRRAHVNDEAQWLVEELRVGLFAERLGTAFPVSEKRVLRTLDRLG